MTAFAGSWYLVDVGEDVMDLMQGTPNASVLPEPVSATPITSRPERRNGQAADWMGVGFLKEVKEEESVLVVGGKKENSVIGRREVEAGSLILIKLVERKSSISVWGSAVSVGSSV